MTKQKASRLSQLLVKFIVLHHSVCLKNTLSLLDDAKVTIKLQTAKHFGNFFVTITKL
nr:MAG TPA: hypothetical protein [Caudoviricetes sp.]